MGKQSYETANSLLSAAKSCGLTETSFHQLPGWRAERVVEDVLDAFTNRGKSGREPRWLGNDLREPTTTLTSAQNLLLEIAPAETPVWLIAEDFAATKSGAPYWVFEGTLAGVSATLDNHHLLEFSVVSRALTWLVGQNHHDVWVAAGAEAIAALRRLGVPSLRR